jgi:hypothetical protein
MFHKHSRSAKTEMKITKKRIFSKPYYKSTTTYMLEQWTLVEPLPLAAWLLGNAPNENGAALVARNQWQEAFLVSVGIQRQRGCARRSKWHGMRARGHGNGGSRVRADEEGGEGERNRKMRMG